MPYLGELIFCESFCKLQRLFAITQRHFRVASWVKRRNLGASTECLCNTFDCFFPRRRMKLAVIQEFNYTVNAPPLSGGCSPRSAVAPLMGDLPE